LDWVERASGVRRFPETGSAVVTGVIGIVLLLVVFIGALSVVVDEYAKGALRTAWTRPLKLGHSRWLGNELRDKGSPSRRQSFTGPVRRSGDS